MISEALFTSARTDTGSDEWGTPRWLYDYLNNTYKFTLDPCSTDANALCEQHFTQETDGLKQTWTGRVYCNPPYSEAKKWMQKAFDSCKEGSAELVVCLIPARTETEFWHDYVDRRALQVFFIRGRLVFECTEEQLLATAVEWFAKRGKTPTDEQLIEKMNKLRDQSAPFPSAVVVYHRDAFKLGALGKTQYSCLDLRTVRQKREQPPAEVTAALVRARQSDVRPAIFDPVNYGDK